MIPRPRGQLIRVLLLLLPLTAAVTTTTEYVGRSARGRREGQQCTRSADWARLCATRKEADGDQEVERRLLLPNRQRAWELGEAITVLVKELATGCRQTGARTTAPQAAATWLRRRRCSQA